MNKRYNDIWESRKAFDLINTNPIAAKLKYENYLEKYPNDYGSYKYYINVLCILNEIDLAKNVVKQMEDILISDLVFENEPQRAEKFKRDIIISKLRILMYKEKYEDFYKIYLENQDILNDDDPEWIHMYCKKKLGILEDKDRSMYTYAFRQVIEYSEKDFLNHIKKHIADCNEGNDGFTSDFPLEKVIEEIKKIIPTNNRLCYDYVADTYIFKYDNCGRSRDDYRLQDYFTVISFHNSNEIITMYPGINCDPINYTDLNYINSNNISKTKRMSQIDKFNLKYKRK